MPAMKETVNKMKSHSYKTVQQQRSRPTEVPILFVSKNYFSYLSTAFRTVYIQCNARFHDVNCPLANCSFCQDSRAWAYV